MPTSTVVTARARPKGSSPAAFEVNGSTRYGGVLVGVDGTPTSRDAIALGARLHEPSGQLTLANVVLMSTPTYQNFHATPAWAARRKMLERERQAAGVAAELTGMASSSVGRGLQQLAKDCAADLLVVGSCGRGLAGRVFLRDDTRGSLNGASCAVAIAPHDYADHPADIRTIGVATTTPPRRRPRSPSLATWPQSTARWFAR